MNLSNLYNYSILTGVWNDLDSDVLKLVKEYLRVHLDRRLLNKDYKVFLDMASDEMNSRIMDYWSKINVNVLKVRYGLNKTSKIKVGISYHDENGNHVLFSLDDLTRDKYYILGITLSLHRDDGIKHYIRREFLEDYFEKYSPNGITDDMLRLMQSEKSTKAYMKVLMLAEDNGYNPAVKY